MHGHTQHALILTSTPTHTHTHGHLVTHNRQHAYTLTHTHTPSFIHTHAFTLTLIAHSLLALLDPWTRHPTSPRAQPWTHAHQNNGRLTNVPAKQSTLTRNCSSVNLCPFVLMNPLFIMPGVIPGYRSGPWGSKRRGTALIICPGPARVPSVSEGPAQGRHPAYTGQCWGLRDLVPLTTRWLPAATLSSPSLGGAGLCLLTLLSSLHW